MDTAITAPMPTRLNDLLNLFTGLLDEIGCRLDSDGWGYEFLSKTPQLVFDQNTVRQFGLVTISDGHRVIMEDSNDGGEYSAPTLRKNFRNAIKMIQSGASLFDAIACKGCEYCEHETY